jgi:hypothetical protein
MGQDSQRDARLRHLSQHLHSLGARALHELLRELVAVHGDDIIARLESFSHLDAETLRAIDARRLPNGPLYIIARRGGER